MANPVQIPDHPLDVVVLGAGGEVDSMLNILQKLNLPRNDSHWTFRRSRTREQGHPGWHRRKGFPDRCTFCGIR